MALSPFHALARLHPDCEVVGVRCRLPLPPEFPNGFEGFLLVPKARIAAASEPPFWRHGETMEIGALPD